MSRHLALVILVLFLLSAFAIAQQPNDDAVNAVRNLEQYREGLIKQWMNDFGNLGRYREANTKLASPSANEARVVFMGDSITDIWKLEKYFPRQALYQPRHRRANDTTDADSVSSRRHRPAAQGRRYSRRHERHRRKHGPDVVGRDRRQLADHGRTRACSRDHIVLSSVLPVNDYTARSKMFFPLSSPAQILELNRWIKDYASKNGCIYLDYFSAMVDSRGLLKRDLADDGLHPNDAGFALMAPLAQMAIDQALAMH